MDDFKEDKVESFGGILERERKKRDMSLYQLSDFIGLDEGKKPLVTASYLSRLEKSNKDNPTIKLILLLVSKLSLDFREVLKCYGYEDILPTNLNKNIDKIEDIIRLSNIKAPIKHSGHNIELEGYLSQKEKEYLIDIIDYVFRYSVCDPEDSLYYVEMLIGKLKLFREKRQSYFSERINILDREFEIVFNREVKNTIIKLNIENEGLIDIVINGIDEELLSQSGEFYLKNDELRIMIGCRNSGSYIEVFSVSNRYK
jgi:transcriptional regulator with XRE-family HTH domain